MITKAIDRSFKVMKERNWDKSFWAIDIHDTILKSNYNNPDIKEDFYPYAKEVLQILSKRTDIVLFLYTCSYPKEITRYLDFFKSHDIHFKYVNENPDALNTAHGYYEKKPYFSVLLEDKSGFDANIDWILIKECLEKY